MKEIISEQIDWDKKNAYYNNKSVPSINSSVRNVITVINNDVRFRLSNALRCYQVLLTNVLLSRKVDLLSVKLHYFVEVGACDERMINLINMGLSREAAKEIDSKLHVNVKIASTKDLLELNRLGKLDTIHTITKKELLGLLTKQ